MTAATESDLRKIEEAITTLTDLANPANAGTATAQQMLPAARAALLAAIEKYGQKKWDDAIKYTISEARDHD